MGESVLDLKHMTCPLPVLRANRALREMAPGGRLQVLATDPASVKDFQSYCRESGHALVSWSEEAGVFRFTIRRRAEPAPESAPESTPGSAPESAAGSAAGRGAGG